MSTRAIVLSIVAFAAGPALAGDVIDVEQSLQWVKSQVDRSMSEDAGAIKPTGGLLDVNDDGGIVWTRHEIFRRPEIGFESVVIQRHAVQLHHLDPEQVTARTDPPGVVLATPDHMALVEVERSETFNRPPGGEGGEEEIITDDHHFRSSFLVIDTRDYDLAEEVAKRFRGIIAAAVEGAEMDAKTKAKDMEKSAASGAATAHAEGSD